MDWLTQFNLTFSVAEELIKEAVAIEEARAQKAELQAKAAAKVSQEEQSSHYSKNSTPSSALPISIGVELYPGNKPIAN